MSWKGGLVVGRLVLALAFGFLCLVTLFVKMCILAAYSWPYFSFLGFSSVLLSESGPRGQDARVYRKIGDWEITTSDADGNGSGINSRILGKTFGLM